MNRALTVVSLLFVGCASTRPETFHVGAPAMNPVPTVERLSPEPLAAEPVAIEFAPTELESYSLDPAIVPRSTRSAADEGLRNSRLTLKGGYYGSEEDTLDDGWIMNLSWMRFFTHYFALEIEAGYFDATGYDGPNASEVSGFPLMVNGRFNLPVWVLDLYAGIGAGTIYYDFDAQPTCVEDGFLLAGNAFLGATVNVADSVALGVEAKYYLTEEASDEHGGLDAIVLMLTVGASL